MSTTLNKEETRPKLSSLFRRISVEDGKLIADCLQSIADERNEALGHVAALVELVEDMNPLLAAHFDTDEIRARVDALTKDKP